MKKLLVNYMELDPQKLELYKKFLKICEPLIEKENLNSLDQEKRTALINFYGKVYKQLQFVERLEFIELLEYYRDGVIDIETFYQDWDEQLKKNSDIAFAIHIELSDYLTKNRQSFNINPKAELFDQKINDIEIDRMNSDESFFFDDGDELISEDEFARRIEKHIDELKSFD